MKTITPLALLIFLLSGPITHYGQSLKDTSVVDYMVIDRAIREKIHRYGADQVLVVMDIDNTILTGHTDLGSDIWYQWQAGELEVKPAPDQLLTKDCLYREAIGLLYELGTMALTDSLLPGYIKSWQSAGVTLFALTSRSPDYRTATERELDRNGIDLSVSELLTIEGRRFSLDYKLDRDLSYSDGILMTTGMNKGEMLAHILGRSGRSFKSILFIDDTRKNIDAVKTRYSACNEADIVLFHYTRILSDRLKANNNQILTPEQAEQMSDDWELLIRTLNIVFPERLSRSDCAN